VQAYAERSEAFHCRFTLFAGREFFPRFCKWGFPQRREAARGTLPLEKVVVNRRMYNS
jgi:hypothetical protein